MSENEPKESQGYVAFGRNVGPIDEKDRELWVKARSKRCATCSHAQSEHKLIPNPPGQDEKKQVLCRTCWVLEGTTQIKPCTQFVAPNDVTLTAEAVAEGARRFAERIQKLTREQLEISSPDPTVVHFLSHSNLQSVIDHVVGLVEKLNDDVAKAITHLSNQLSPAVDAKVEDVRGEVTRLRNKVADYRTEVLALRSEVAAAKPDDQTLSELAAVKGLLAAAERRLTDSNEAHARVAAENKAAIEKLTKAFESFRVRVSNRIALEERGGNRKTTKLRDWLAAISFTITTKEDRGWLSHFVDDRLITKHPIGKRWPCAYCEANAL